MEWKSDVGFRLCTDDFLLRGVEQKALTESLDSPLVQSLVGRTLLLACLREEDPDFNPPVYRYGQFGKPYLANDPHLYFNISHCKDAVACVTSKHEIGVDVESLILPERELMEIVLNELEIAAVLESREPDRTFTQFWTKKESLIKYRGICIDDNIKDILQENCCEYYSLSGSNYEICVCFKKAERA